MTESENDKEPVVWAVFYISDETLHWELDSIHATFNSADECLKSINEEAPYLEGLKTESYPLLGGRRVVGW